MTTPEELDALVARLLDGPQRVYRDLHAAKKAATAITALRARVAELEAATDQLQYIASANATRAEKADTDLIRRGAAIKAVTDADRDCRGAHGARENIAALPAHPVQEPPSSGVTAGATGPERIWAWEINNDAVPPNGYYAIAEVDDSVEYIRADLASTCAKNAQVAPAPVAPAEGLANRRAYQVGYAAGQAAALRSAPPVGVWPDFIAPPKYENPCEGWEDPRLPDFRLIWETARALGYAIGLHGSMKRDCDLIAAPWVDNPAHPDDLIKALCVALNATQVGGVEAKPVGRIAVILQIDGYVKHIDLSIMPAPPVGARVTGWQQIETAPRDGTIIVAISGVAGHNGYSIIFWDEDGWAGYTAEDEKRLVRFPPALWCDIPEPPAALLPAGEGE